MASSAVGLSDVQSINRSFLFASATGDVDRMEECLKKSSGACANATDKGGDGSVWVMFNNDQSERHSTALHLACLTHSDASIQFLCQRYPEMVQSVDDWGYSPFHTLFKDSTKRISRVAFKAFAEAGIDFAKIHGGNCGSTSLFHDLAKNSEYLSFFQEALKVSPEIKTRLLLHMPSVLCDLVISYSKSDEKMILNQKSIEPIPRTPVANAILYKNLPLIKFLRNNRHVDWSPSRSFFDVAERKPKTLTLAEEADLLIQEEQKTTQETMRTKRRREEAEIPEEA